MKFNYKKIASVFASAVMLSSTIGFAAAASYPAPFVVGGVSDAAVVFGSNSDSRDWTAALDIATDLNAGLSGAGGKSAVSGIAWQVKTSSDSLELGESINAVESFIDDTDLPILANGEISNEKGTAKYEQFLYFDDTASSRVEYQEDDDSNVGLFFKINDGVSFARYVMDFTTAFKSDIILATSTLEDFDDEEITMLGKTYTITKAINTTSGTELTLMSGALKTTVSNGEEITIDGRSVSVLVTATTKADFTIDGETTGNMNAGDTYKLDDGTYLGLSKISYQNFAGGVAQATIYLGADKILMNNGSAIEVNAETIGDAIVTITETISNNDLSIKDITINMTAEDDLYVSIGGKLSESEDLTEPEVLFSQNWDIEFAGMEAIDTEPLSIKPYSSDKKYYLNWQNFNGDDIKMPLFYTNDTGIFPGEKAGYEFRISPNGTYNMSITKNDYFILNTADPHSSTSNARSFLVQYRGADKHTATDPKATFDIVGVENGRTETVQAGAAEMGNVTLKLGGSTFKFRNTSSAASKNFNIVLQGADYSDSGAITTNSSMSIYMRTKYNALINFTDTSVFNDSGGGSTGEATPITAANLLLNVSVDDGNRDGDSLVLGTEAIFGASFGNGTASDASASIIQSGSWITDPEDTDVTLFQTKYGATIKETNPSSAPSVIEVTIPESVVEPLLYVSSGDITVTTGGTGTGAQILAIRDSEVSNAKDMNLIVVGGSCINTVAAKILGGDMLCAEDFTAKTNVGPGQYLIKTVKTSEAVTGGSEDKIALLAAGYNVADTENAVAAVKAGISTDIMEQVYPIITTDTV